MNRKFTTEDGVTGFYPVTLLGAITEVRPADGDKMLSNYRDLIDRLQCGAEGMLLKSSDAHDKFTSAREVEETRPVVEVAVAKTVSYLGITDITADTQKAVVNAVMASVWHVWKVEDVEKG